VATLGLGVAAPGRADLDHDVTRLVEGWQPYGQVLRDEPRLAERSSPTLIFTPTAAKALKRARCLTIAVIGPSSANFVVRPLGPDRMREPGADGSLASVAGLVELTRCGRDRFALGAVLVEMRSPRAVLETVLVESEKPLPRATKVVPQRDPGPVEPFTLLDLRPVPVPIAARSGSVEARLRREGGRDVASEPVKSNADGAGSLRKTLAAGCYRFELLAEPPAPGSRTELSFAPTIDGPARVVSIDSGNGLQSTTTLCAGAETQARLDFSGAPAGSALLLASARWPLPDGLPEAWGAPARAAIAATLHRYRARASGFPVDHALGIQGPTLLPARVEPGACYIAVVAAINGRPSALSLAVKTSGVSAQNHAGSEADGTLVSFCVRAGTEALLEVDSRGYALIWLYALFQTGRFELGAEPG
jgi:hypothetical protein